MLARSLALTSFFLASTAMAQPGSTGPQPLPLPAPIATPQDVAYPGVLKLEVDVRDTRQRIFRVKEIIPAKPGPLTLLYPSWLPGNHAPRGPIEKLAGLTFKANGQVIPWKRDPVDVFAFHIDVPTGADSVEAEFQYLSATAAPQGSIYMTNEMMNVRWNAVALYPAGHFARQVTIEPTVLLPAGWKYGVALDTASFTDDVVRFKPVDFDTLVDSPMYAGLHFRQFDLDPGGRSQVRLNVVADTAAQLEATPEQIEKHRELVRQADKLFGARHFDRYEFLLSLSDRMSGTGIEHHRSSENGVMGAYFTEWDKNAPRRDLLPHEYTHSWNGKYRRGADLFTANFNVPMRDSLLWVYEGQTQFWGNVLSSRSGLITKDQAFESLAMTAATYDVRVGRSWRALEDTTNDPIINARRPQAWTSWQRSEDYYQEGQLVWLDADTLIRERSGGKRSLDDFAKAFFGMRDGDWTPNLYTFEDVAAALNKVEPYDWLGFLTTRVRNVAPRPPLDGLTRGGWKLVYTDTPTSYWRDVESAGRLTNLTYSLGVALNSDGDITSVLWDGPAFKAGLAVGSRIMSVGGETYSADRLKAAIKAARDGTPIRLSARTGDQFADISIDYRNGLRYPRLERIAGTPDRLSALYAPRK